MLIEETNRCKGSICFYNKDVLHIRCITESDAPLCKTVIDFILYLIDYDDRVGRYSALDLKKKRSFDQLIGQTIDQVRRLPLSSSSV